MPIFEFQIEGIFHIIPDAIRYDMNNITYYMML